MKIEEITLKEYFKFVKKVYKSDTNYKDNKTALIKLITQKGAFYNNTTQKIIACTNLEHNNKTAQILAVSILIIHKNNPDNLYISFFESLPKSLEAVTIMLNHAKVYANKNKCNRVYLGIDGHVNNCFGFTTTKQSPSFGDCYNPLYYIDYFRYQDDFDEIKAVTYTSTMQHIKTETDKDIKRVNAKRENQITIEKADMSYGFKNSINRFTNLNNLCFKDDPFYYKREPQEDYEIFKAMQPLLSDNNLLFAKYKDKDIGFFLWYPDFNEFISIGKSAGISTYIKHKMFKKQPNVAKVVAMGVDTNYIKKAPMLCLLNTGTHMVNDKTNLVQGGWILDSNTKSKAITSRYMDGVGKEYFIYECKL